MRLEVSEKEFGNGGMRIEGLSHDLLKVFPKGTDALLKHYNDAVINAAEDKNRSIKPLQKRLV